MISLNEQLPQGASLSAWKQSRKYTLAITSTEDQEMDVGVGPLGEWEERWIL